MNVFAKIGAAGVVLGGALMLIGSANSGASSATPSVLTNPAVAAQAHADYVALDNQMSAAPAAQLAKVCTAYKKNPGDTIRQTVALYTAPGGTIPTLTSSVAKLALDVNC